MRLKISMRNSKIGDVPNISLPPGTSCVPEVPCYTDGCYAQNSYRMYPNVREAWDSNLKLYKEDPLTFFNDLRRWLVVNDPRRFRLFVGGDFPDEQFYKWLEMVVAMRTRTDFLVFTKRYDYDYSRKPDNLQVVLSTWPGLELPTNTDLPWAWLEEDTRRKAEAYFVCSGGCGECGYFCWNALKPDIPVVFPRH